MEYLQLLHSRFHYVYYIVNSLRRYILIIRHKFSHTCQPCLFVHHLPVGHIAPCNCPENVFIPGMYRTWFFITRPEPVMLERVFDKLQQTGTDCSTSCMASGRSLVQQTAKNNCFCCFSIFFIYWICRFLKGMVWDCCWLHSSSSLCSDLCTNIIWRFKCLFSGSSWPGTGWHTVLSCWFSKMWRIYLHKFVTTKLLRTDDDANFRKILWRFCDLKLRQSYGHKFVIITLSLL